MSDASAKSKLGVSLNGQLLPRPNLNPLLSPVLARFRVFEVTISADISKIFREIQSQPSEHDFHRFLQDSFFTDFFLVGSWFTGAWYN